MKQQWQEYLDLMKQEIVPALGCTEPMTVALAAAKCRELLGGIPDQLQIWVTPNLYKNGMGVGVPGTGGVGLPIAAAVGITGGRSEKGLEVLSELTQIQVWRAETLLRKGVIAIRLHDHQDTLYTLAQATLGDRSARVVIEKTHTYFSLIELDGHPLEHNDGRKPSLSTANEKKPEISMAAIYEFATQAPIASLEFIDEAARLNGELSESGVSGAHGLRVGHTLKKQIERKLLGDDLLTRAMLLSSAASDARMDGVMLPAMSNSGSGNQGIAATMPVVACTQILGSSDETRIRALTLSHLIAIYVKSSQQRLSALCAANTAAMGAGAAITWLLGGKLEEVSNCIKAMTGDVAGIICDGAKAGCSVKVSTGAASAVKCALMAIDQTAVTDQQGIVEKTADLCIRNLGRLSRQGMQCTDAQIIDIIRNKPQADTAIG